MPRPALASLCFALALGCTGSPDDIAAHRAPNLFGDDDRTDWYAHPDVALQDDAARAVAAVIPVSRLDVTDPENVVVASRGTHTDVHALCPGDVFGDQPVSARCTAFVIAPTLMMTAGHCFDGEADCAESAFVFNWRYEASDRFPRLTVDDVYYCSSVAVVENVGDRDFAVVNLDRPVMRPRGPVPVRYAVEELAVDTPVVTVGHSAGLPLKIDTGGRVVAFEPEFFETTSDTFSGNSGSPVFLADGTAVGVHFRGPDDYVEASGCRINAQRSDNPEPGGGGDSEHTGIAIGALCEAGVSTPLCGEPESLCRADCNCPEDAICRTEGDAIYCAPRCGSDSDCREGHRCVSSRCEPAPGCFAGQLWARDACGRPVVPEAECADTEVCERFACVDAADGDVCGNASALASRSTTLNVDLRERYRDLTRGSCGGFGQERVWRFELAEATRVQFQPRDDGWVLYLRRSCDDASDEVACSGADGVADIDEELSAGTYFLFADARVLATRITTIRVEFGEAVSEPDAGTPLSSDAGQAPSATDGSPPSMEMEDAGCSCRAGADDPAVPPGWALLGLGVLVVRRARRSAKAR